MPAAFCGVCGLKTTKDLLPTDGILPLSHTFDTVSKSYILLSIRYCSIVINIIIINNIIIIIIIVVVVVSLLSGELLSTKFI